jgi:hypothetical protein
MQKGLPVAKIAFDTEQFKGNLARVLKAFSDLRHEQPTFQMS